MPSRDRAVGEDCTNQLMKRKKRGPMKLKLYAVAAAILAASLVGSYAYAGDPPAPPKKHVIKKQPPKPTVEDQIQSLRQEFQGQIDSLKTDLATKDAEFRHFVLKHIDATLDMKDVEMIRTKAKTQCPTGLHPLCADLRKQATSALKEDASSP